MTGRSCATCSWWHRFTGFCCAEGDYTAADGSCPFWEAGRAFTQGEIKGGAGQEEERKEPISG